MSNLRTHISYFTFAFFANRLDFFNRFFLHFKNNLTLSTLNISRVFVFLFQECYDLYSKGQFNICFKNQEKKPMSVGSDLLSDLYYIRTNRPRSQLQTCFNWIEIESALRYWSWSRSCWARASSLADSSQSWDFELSSALLQAN